MNDNISKRLNTSGFYAKFIIINLKTGFDHGQFYTQISGSCKNVN